MAQILTSLSGLQFSAASAAFAPTNSADVSAIASAYQVVSSVGTSQNGPKSIVTGINGLFISARYADTANEARKDGSGRTISSLPDSAAVSAIASSYAESAASSKQDTLTFGYNTADQISSIDGSALGGMDEAAVSAIASAYAESAASSKQDTLTFGYDAEDKISSIDGSAIAGGNEIVTSLETATSLGMSGTALVTITSVSGINGMDLSAKKAEYANSADHWASAYTKLDASASSKFVQTANIETQYGYVTAIKGTGLMGCDTAAFINSGSSLGFADANTPTALPDGTHTVTASKPIFTTPTITVREVGQSTGKTVNPASMVTTARITGLSALNPPLEIVATTDISFTAAYANYESAQLAHQSSLANYQLTSDMSGYIPNSMSSDFQQVTGMSSYVPYSSLEYNTASAISGINGSALAAGSTYSAGEGIDITDDVISVEAPVDIVAGPGIVIDNPDGNTLRVSMAADYETLLWSGDVFSGNISLSEPRNNFSRLCFVTQDTTGYNQINYCDASSEYVSNNIVTHYPGSANSLILKFSQMSATDPSSYNIFHYGRTVFTFGQVVDVTTSNNAPHYKRIYGINRTASAQ